MINKSMNIKNRTENGFRLDLNLSIPHSKALLASRLFISSQRETVKTNNTKIKVIKLVVNIATIRLNLSK